MTHRIVILGGSGFVGRHLAERLCGQGHQVRILTRNRERHREDLLVLPGLELVQSNIHDPVELERQLADRDIVINLVGILHERRRGGSDLSPARHGDFEKNHVELPRSVVNTCVRLGIPRLLHMSALAADPNGPSAYLRSKGLGEEIVLQAGENRPTLSQLTFLDNPKALWGQGLHVTIFRPSVIFGDGDSFFNQFAKLLRSVPLFIPLAKAQAKLQPVWVEDVVSAFVQAIDDPKTFGKAYDLCGPKAYTLEEILRYTQGLVGRHQKIITLCDRLATVQAMIFERLPGKIITRDNLRSLSVDNICTRNDLLQVFGIEASSMESIVPEYLGGGRAGYLTQIRSRRRLV